MTSPPSQACFRPLGRIVAREPGWQLLRHGCEVHCINLFRSTRMTLVKVVYRMRGVLKILRRLPAVIALTVAFPSHKEFEGFFKHACVAYMVNLVFLFTFNLYWLWRRWEKPIDFVASVGRKTVDMEDIVQF